jgi:hypothetical protein
MALSRTVDLDKIVYVKFFNGKSEFVNMADLTKQIGWKILAAQNRTIEAARKLLNELIGWPKYGDTQDAIQAAIVIVREEQKRVRKIDGDLEEQMR